MADEPTKAQDDAAAIVADDMNDAIGSPEGASMWTSKPASGTAEVHDSLDERKGAGGAYGGVRSQQEIDQQEQRKQAAIAAGKQDQQPSSWMSEPDKAKKPGILGGLFGKKN